MKHASVDKAKRVDSGCRNNGSCPHCRRSRTMSAARVAAGVKIEAANVLAAIATDQRIEREESRITTWRGWRSG